MSLRQFQLGSKTRMLVFQGFALSLGAVMMAGTAAMAQTRTTTRGVNDVIISPDAGRARTTGYPNSGSSTPGYPSRGGSVETPSANRQDTSRQNPATAKDVRFKCRTVAGQYTVMYFPENRPDQAYPWAVPSTMGGGWDPARRCGEITRRLESYRPDGLQEMKTGSENGYNTVCVTTDRVPGCRIVFTVPRGQDPVSTRDRVFQNLSVADSGRQTQGIYTYGQNGQDGEEVIGQIGQVLGIGGSRNQPGQRMTDQDINLKPFLSPADGGTGERLTQSNLVNPAETQGETKGETKSLKPSLFRR